jgi:hypothetical protein
MKHRHALLTAFLLVPLALLLAPLARAGEADVAYRQWNHAGLLYILTTPEGAALPAGAVVEGFPLLVRLHRDFFAFHQAQPGGEDVRFSTGSGQRLAYQIEHWDAAAGEACVWVRVPRIEGNARQAIRMHWGRADAASESDGRAVFNASNGYLSAWHLGAAVCDEVGTLASQDTGTTATPGLIGLARRFPGKQGVFGGDQIAGYPTGSDAHSSEVWFRAEKPNGTLLAWGNEQAQGKVVMRFRSPPHISMDCYFSDGNVAGASRLAMGPWTHVMHTYEQGRSRLYVNGVLDGASQGSGAPLNIRSPARLWLGGWYGNFDFVGELDEVRVSRVARSADWVRLQFENQKPLQTLVGPLVQPGAAFSVSAERLTVREGESVTLTAQAGGAQKVVWLLKDGAGERVVAVDRFAFTFHPGRITGDQSVTLRFQAVLADGERTRDIAVTVQEAIPDPVFTLAAPAAWDGRETIEIVPQVSNRNAMQATDADELTIVWSVAPLAVIQESLPGKLVLRRAQNSGNLTVTATISNGGSPVTHAANIVVTEPKHDAWVMRTPALDEKPEEGQFYARDDGHEGTLYCNGTLENAADGVFLRVYADGQPYQSVTHAPAADNTYAFAVRLKAGLVNYRVEFGTTTAGRETVLHAAGDLVCGDAYVISGQSNAEATDIGKDDPDYRSPWIRTFGSMSGNPQGLRLWGSAQHRNRDGAQLQIGYWGMELARRIVEKHQMPICILNGAVGGTRIDQHQRNAARPDDTTTIYGRLLWRAREARLTHGIRGILWHQGENDQGADGPTGGFGWETYRQFFIELAGGWKQDFPNVQHYYVFQIWPKACAMGIHGSDNRLREVQRTLPTAFSNLRVMSTLGIEPPGGCHFPAAGYAEFARLMAPLVERDHYGATFPAPITPPNLQRVCFTTDERDEVRLEFDQRVKWDDSLLSEFTLDGEPSRFVSGTGSGQTITLQLASATSAQRLTYLDSKSWSQARLLRGENGLAALTFCDVPILTRPPEQCGSK